MATTKIKKEESQVVGVYQLKNGLWAYRFIVKINGEQKTQRRSKDEEGKPFRTQKQAARAREKALKKIHDNGLKNKPYDQEESCIDT